MEPQSTTESNSVKDFNFYFIFFLQNNIMLLIAPKANYILSETYTQESGGILLCCCTESLEIKCPIVLTKSNMRQKPFWLVSTSH